MAVVEERITEMGRYFETEGEADQGEKSCRSSTLKKTEPNKYELRFKDNQTQVVVSDRSKSSNISPTQESRLLALDNVSDNNLLSKSVDFKDRILQSVSEESKKKISVLLNEVNNLSDIEKLLLYLQLPTGTLPENDPMKQKNFGNPLGKKADMEVTQTYTWIQSHLEEDQDVSLPKQEVYEEYRSFCESNKSEALCAADFGKVMKHVFPSVKPRRLGTRGNSRYCYSGLRKKIEIKPPSLPDIDLKESNSKDKAVNDTDEINSASCHLLFEWTEKLLGKKFSSLCDLASYLVQNMYVDSRSVAAFTVLSAGSGQQAEKGPFTSNLLKPAGGNRRKETQIHLQRKIQEKKLIKEQKKKLQEQRSHFSKLNHGKIQTLKKSDKKESPVPMPDGRISAGSDVVPVSESIQITETEENKRKTYSTSTCDEVSASKEIFLQTKGREQTNIQQINSSNKNTPGQQKFGCVDELQERKKRTSKMPIPRNTTSAVCITQGVPSIIIVPSLHITDLGTKMQSSNNVSKYKKIQPKPSSRCLSGCTVTTDKNISTSGSGFVNDVHPSLEEKQKTQFPQHLYNSSNKLSRTDDQKVLPTLSMYKTEGIPLPEKIRYRSGEEPASSINSLSLEVEGDLENLKFQSRSALLSKTSSSFLNDHVKQINGDSEIKFRSKLLTVSSPEEENGINATIKRHSEETDSQIIVSKKPHLDDVLNSSGHLSSGSLSPWNKESQDLLCSLSSEFQETLTEDSTSKVKPESSLIDQEGVSIHQLETDALIEYLHGSSIESSNSDVDSQNISFQENQVSVIDALQKTSHSDEKGRQTPHLTNKIAQLSQLRMLLERNLPISVTKGIFLTSNKHYSGSKNINRDHSTSLCSHEQNETAFLNKNETKNINELNKCSVQMNKANFAEIDSSVSFPPNIHWQNCTSLPKSVSVVNGPDGITTAISEQNVSIITDSSKTNMVIQDNLKIDSVIDAPDKCHSGDISITFPIENSDLEKNQLHYEVKCSSTQTQVPSVPPSPNTRRRAFNFMPISPRQTPISEGSIVSHSPVPQQLISNMISIAVGPSQPPSAASSPFVSPRSTPVPLSRSRHSSGQSSYSTSRQTPFQNFDSGVSSISTSPFISPQPTPVPVSRLRHNSSHGPGKTVTFSTTNNPHVIHTQSSFPSRSRHSSGPGGPPTISSVLSPRSAPLSPMIGDSCVQVNVSLSAVSGIRSRHNSSSSITLLSPVSEQISPNYTSGLHSAELFDIGKESSSSISLSNIHETEQSGKFLSDYSTKSKEHNEIQQKVLNASVCKPSPIVSEHTASHWAPRRQRHASSSVINQKVTHVAMNSDSVSQEIQSLLKDATYSVDTSATTRSHSVPLHQMLRNLINQCSASSTEEDYSKSSSPTSHSFHFPTVNCDTYAGSGRDDLEMAFEDSHSSKKRISEQNEQDADSLVQAPNAIWTNVNDIDTLSGRRNLTDLLEQPLEVDLQTTLEDLKDCDNDFSKLAQELEEMNQNEETCLS